MKDIALLSIIYCVFQFNSTNLILNQQDQQQDASKFGLNQTTSINLYLYFQSSTL